MTIQQLIEVLKFYQKQVKDVDKASSMNFETYQNSTVSQRQKRSRKLALCQEAKERAFWEVVEAIKKSEFGPVLFDITNEELKKIRTFNSRYLPAAQAADLAFKKETKNAQ